MIKVKIWIKQLLLSARLETFKIEKSEMIIYVDVRRCIFLSVVLRRIFIFARENDTYTETVARHSNKKKCNQNKEYFEFITSKI